MSDNTLGVIPIFIGPIQVLLAILPAMLMALFTTIIHRLKPSALKETGRLLWKKKIGTLCFIGVIVGACYGVGFIREAFGKNGPVVIEQVSGDWPAARGGPNRTGYAKPADTDKMKQDPTNGDVNWTADTKIKTFYASPALIGGLLFISAANQGVFGDQGAIYCIDADKGGKPLWSFEPKGYRATFSSPSVAEYKGKKYLVCGEGLHMCSDARIVCLSLPAKGDPEKLWEVRTKNHVESSPCIYEGKAYIGSGDDGMWCVDLEPTGGQGNVRWHLKGTAENGTPTMGKQASTEIFADCEASPIAADGKVYFGQGTDPKDKASIAAGVRGHAVACVDAETGKLIWRHKVSGPVFGSPSLAGKRVIVGTGHADMVNSAEQVSNKWLALGLPKAELDRRMKEFEACGRVICLEFDGKEVKEVWNYPTGQTVLGAAAVDEKSKEVFVASRDGVLHRLNLDLGTLLSKYETRAVIGTSPVLTPEHVYVLTDTGSIYCLDRKTMELVWEAKAGATKPFISSPVVGRGHLYVGTTNEGVKCIGYPGTPKPPVWGGSMGGPGVAGCIDGSPLAAQGEARWRFPRGAGTEAAAATITAPAACMSEPVPPPKDPSKKADDAPKKILGLYVPLTAKERVGLVKLLGGETVRLAEEKWFYATPNPVFLSAAVNSWSVTADKAWELLRPKTETASQPTDSPAKAASTQSTDKADAVEQVILPLHVFIVDGKVGMTNRNLHVLSAVDGQPAWKLPVAAEASGEFVLGDAVLAIYDQANKLTVLKPAEARQPGATSMPLYQTSWTAEVEKPVGCPLITADMVVTVSASRKVAVRSLSGGVVLAEWALPADPTTGAIRFGDSLAVGTANGVLGLGWNGASKWQGDCGPVKGALVAAKGRLACTTESGELLVYDAAGQELARFTDAQPGIAPILAGDTVLYTNPKCLMRAEVTALEEPKPAKTAADGASATSAPASLPTSAAARAPKAPVVVRWIREAEMAGTVTAGPVLADSTVCFGTDSKGLVCVRNKK